MAEESELCFIAAKAAEADLATKVITLAHGKIKSMTANFGAAKEAYAKLKKVQGKLDTCRSAGTLEAQEADLQGIQSRLEGDDAAALEDLFALGDKIE